MSMVRIGCMMSTVLLALLAASQSGGVYLGGRSMDAAAVDAPSASAAYGLAVSGAEQDFIPGDSSLRPPEGRRWIVVNASLHNIDGHTVVIDVGTLALVDQWGERHYPEPADQFLQPALVGATLARGEWMLGQAVFDVPREVVGEWLEWCPAGPNGCVKPLRSPIPLTPSGS